MNIALTDKVVLPHTPKDATGCSDEGEAVAIAAGYYLATGKKATVYMSADGFMNTLNFLTSWMIPESIGVHLVISIGRMEESHYIATQTTEEIINLIATYDYSKSVTYRFVHKES
jgi:sulfopyruvate decarboxylase TPP-binding subunit